MTLEGKEGNDEIALDADHKRKSMLREAQKI